MPGMSDERKIPPITRRAALAAGASIPLALLSAGSRPVLAADSGRWAAVAERAGRLDQLHSLVIGRGGEVTFARAFRGPGPGQTVNVKSVSKTLVASLTGAALDRGVLQSVDQTLDELIPERIPADSDPKVRGITIAQLLTMRAGLEPTSGPQYGRWVESRNWVAHALSRPMVAEPGGRMIYSTGSYHVLGAVLARAAGRSLLALARDWLAEPLDIALPPWTRDPQGLYLGGNNMSLSPLGLWRFGELWRSGGRWRGDRVLSAAWVEASWTARTRSPFSGHDYGYGWFLTEADGHRIAYARGYGGQMLYVVPALDLTVVVTSDPTRPARSGGHVGDLNALLTETIMPAAAQA